MSSDSRVLPHITVATVIYKNDKFLLVIEESAGKKVYNQPAGHMEVNETLVEAAIRETKEETGWQVDITGFLGVSQYKAPNDITYVRHTFIANAIQCDENAVLDDVIIDTTWMSYEDILSNRDKLRSSLVLYDIEKFRSGLSYDLAILDGFIE